MVCMAKSASKRWLGFLNDAAAASRRGRFDALDTYARAAAYIVNPAARPARGSGARAAPSLSASCYRRPREATA